MTKKSIISFDKLSHTYSINNKILPSVTHIIDYSFPFKESLYYKSWVMDNVNPSIITKHISTLDNNLDTIMIDYDNGDIAMQLIKDTSSRLGNLIHNMSHNYFLNHNEIDNDIRVLSGLKLFINEYAGQIEYISSEQIVSTNDFAGTYDLKFKLNGKTCLIDLKTFGIWRYELMTHDNYHNWLDKDGLNKEIKKKKNKVAIQLAAYNMADEYTNGQLSDECYILHIGIDYYKLIKIEPNYDKWEKILNKYKNEH